MKRENNNSYSINNWAEWSQVPTQQLSRKNLGKAWVNLLPPIFTFYSNFFFNFINYFHAY